MFCSANESSSEPLLLLVAGWVRTDGMPGSFNGRERQRERKRSRFASEGASEFTKQVHEAQRPSNLAEEVGY